MHQRTVIAPFFHPIPHTRQAPASDSTPARPCGPDLGTMLDMVPCSDRTCPAAMLGLPAPAAQLHLPLGCGDYPTSGRAAAPAPEDIVHAGANMATAEKTAPTAEVVPVFDRNFDQFMDRLNADASASISPTRRRKTSCRKSARMPSSSTGSSTRSCRPAHGQLQRER